MKLYVAGPMSRESFCSCEEEGHGDCVAHDFVVPAGQKDPWDFNYPAFHAAQTVLEDVGFEVKNPAQVKVPRGVIVDWSWYMRKGLDLLLRSDGVAVLDGWKKSRGARIETQLAQDLGMPIAPVLDWADGKVVP